MLLLARNLLVAGHWNRLSPLRLCLCRNIYVPIVPHLRLRLVHRRRPQSPPLILPMQNVLPVGPVHPLLWVPGLRSRAYRLEGTPCPIRLPSEALLPRSFLTQITPVFAPRLSAPSTKPERGFQLRPRASVSPRLRNNPSRSLKLSVIVLHTLGSGPSAHREAPNRLLPFPLQLDPHHPCWIGQPSMCTIIRRAGLPPPMVALMALIPNPQRLDATSVRTCPCSSLAFSGPNIVLLWTRCLRAATRTGLRPNIAPRMDGRKLLGQRTRRTGPRLALALCNTTRRATPVGSVSAIRSLWQRRWGICCSSTSRQPASSMAARRRRKADVSDRCQWFGAPRH